MLSVSCTPVTVSSQTHLVSAGQKVLYQVEKGWGTWRGLGAVPRDSFVGIPRGKSHSSGAADWPEPEVGVLPQWGPPLRGAEIASAGLGTPGQAGSLGGL